MMMILAAMALMIGQVTPPPEMNMISTAAIAAVCSLISGIALYNKGRQARIVTIDKQPVEIALAKDYVTRSEFAEFKGELKADVREMRGAYEKLLMLINERDEKLTSMIENVAKGAFEGRRRIHETVNTHSSHLAVLSDRVDVAKSIGKLGAAVMATMNREKKTTNQTHEQR